MFNKDGSPLQPWSCSRPLAVKGEFLLTLLLDRESGFGFARDELDCKRCCRNKVDIKVNSTLQRVTVQVGLEINTTTTTIFYDHCWCKKCGVIVLFYDTNEPLGLETCIVTHHQRVIEELWHHR